MKRLITFGCSFTDYSWPTWADIIALDRGCAYENWAMGGGGNQQIARRAMYRASRGLTADDWVMIQWSSIVREDRFKENRWITEGSVVMSPTYRGDFVHKYWDWNNDVINTAHSRISTPLLLGENLRYQMAMSWNDQGPEQLAQDSAITDYWSAQLPVLPSLPVNAQPFGGRTADGHPDPAWWLHWVQTQIYPQWDWRMQASTIDRVMQCQLHLEHLVQSGVSQRTLQHQANIWCCAQGWQLNKIKPGSDTLTPNSGSDVLM